MLILLSAGTEDKKRKLRTLAGQTAVADWQLATLQILHNNCQNLLSRSHAVVRFSVLKCFRFKLRVYLMLLLVKENIF